MNSSGENSPTTAEMAGRREGQAGSEPNDWGSRNKDMETKADTSMRGMTGNGAMSSDGASETALVSPEETERFKARWDESQRSFIDEPRASVEKADHLVAELMQSVANGFANERESLETQWSRGEEVSTEDQIGRASCRERV